MLVLVAAAATRGGGRRGGGGGGVLARVGVAVITHALAEGGTHAARSEALGLLADVARAASGDLPAAGASGAPPPAVVAAGFAATAAASAGGGGSRVADARVAVAVPADTVTRLGRGAACRVAPHPIQVMPVNPLAVAPPPLLRALFEAVFIARTPTLDWTGRDAPLFATALATAAVLL